MKLDESRDEDRRRNKLPPDRMALKVAHLGESGEHGIAYRAGLRKGDVIVAVDGDDRRRNESQLIEYAVSQKQRGDTIAVTVIRDGSRKTMLYVLP
jgi:C-terminal processing protease CtpA/Prc